MFLNDSTGSLPFHFSFERFTAKCIRWAHSSVTEYLQIRVPGSAHFPIERQNAKKEACCVITSTFNDHHRKFHATIAGIKVGWLLQAG